MNEFHLNSNIFIQEDAFENVVCEMAAIVSRGMSSCVVSHCLLLTVVKEPKWGPGNVWEYKVLWLILNL